MLVASTDCKAEVGVVSCIPREYSYFRGYITRRLHALGHAVRDESTADYDGVSRSRPTLIKLMQNKMVKRCSGRLAVRQPLLNDKLVGLSTGLYSRTEALKVGLHKQ